MRINVIHLGGVLDVLVASSINQGFARKYGKPEITWILGNEESQSVFRYTNKVRAVLASEALNEPLDSDLLVNLSPSVHPADPVLSYKEFVGFNGTENSSEFYEILYGKRKTGMTPFQVYYRLAGMTWRGEGYGINYYPKTRARKDSVALAIDHAKLRHFVADNLVPEGAFKMVLVPYKRNLYRRMDEINRCSHILTDDLLTMHLSLYLRKKVHFLETIPLNTRVEFFGNGRIYSVPPKIVT